MKYKWTSAALGLLMAVAFFSDTLADPSAARTHIPPLAQASASFSLLKSQVSHLRTIDPFAIEIVPGSRPVPPEIGTGSTFGLRNHPILGVEKMHEGLDFPAPPGTPVLASAAGRVLIAVDADTSSYGNHLLIWHDHEFQTLYAHLSCLEVKENDIVDEGDTIGYVGSTGRSTDPHLHYEVIREGVRVDPEEFL